MQYLETLLGEQGLKIAWWLAAFIIVLVLVVVVLRLLKSLTGGRLNVSDRGARGRAPRLGVTEYFNLDRQGRRLVIIRRDNIEHLVLIGGPNDVLIESSIVRGERMAAPRAEAGYGRADNELAGTPEPVVAARPLPDFAPAALEQREPQPETRLPPPPAVNDRTPVADIPPDHLAQRLEEVLRKPLAPRVEVQAPATPRSEPAPVRAGPMAGFAPSRPPISAPPISGPPVSSAPAAPAVPEVNVPPVKAPEPAPAKPALPDLLADALRPRPPAAPQPTVPARGPAAFAPPAVRAPEPRVEPAPAEQPAARKPDAPVPAMPAPPAVVKPEPPALKIDSPAVKPEPPASRPEPPAPKPEPVAARPEPTPANEPPAAQPAKPAASANPFDSLEEEMAKLLGRGLGDKL